MPEGLFSHGDRDRRRDRTTMAVADSVGEGCRSGEGALWREGHGTVRVLDDRAVGGLGDALHCQHIPIRVTIVGEYSNGHRLVLFGGGGVTDGDGRVIDRVDPD